jgi:23S rRNA (guanine745-N1)-methyltransferase
MVSARAHFLNSANYEPVANKLAEIVFAQIADDKETCLMDAGCGEGYYFDYVLNELKGKNAGNDLCFIGLDISKAAIAEAAKRNKQVTWVVGTNRQPPVESASVDVILCVFGFQSFGGFHKTLKAGGRVILVEPGPDHLKELREIIYTEVRKTDPPDLSYLEERGLSLLDRQALQFKTGVINNQQINNLLIMTPHFFRATKRGREAAANVQELDVTVDVVFRTLEKK